MGNHHSSSSSASDSAQISDNAQIPVTPAGVECPICGKKPHVDSPGSTINHKSHECLHHGEEENSHSSHEHLSEIKNHFWKSYPNGLLTKAEFVRDNQLLHPNTPESFWSHLFSFLDRDDNGFLDLREYLIAYSLMSRMNVKTERLLFWFELLDHDGSGDLSLKECEYLFSVLLDMQDVISGETEAKSDSGPVKNSSEDESQKDEKHEQLVAQSVKGLFNRMDSDHDGRVTFEEFQTAAHKDELLKSLLHIEMDLEKQDQLHKAMYLNPKDFDLQVGGHGSEKQVKKAGRSRAMLLTKTNNLLFRHKEKQRKDPIIKTDDKVWKPLEKREFEFYEYLHHPLRENDSISMRLREFLPKYYGRTFVDYEEPEPRTVYYVILQDCTHGMKHASVADLKIGTKGHDSQASLRKRAQQIALCELTTSRSLGFRFCGYKAWDIKSQSNKSFSKFQGGMLLAHQVGDHLKQFVTNGDRVRYKLLENALPQLEAIRDWFREQKKYAFYSSSILLCYDGEDDGNDDNIVVKMIDFAHVEIDEKERDLDRSYLYGIEKLIEICKKVVVQCKE